MTDLTSVDAKSKNQTGHVQVHAQIRQALLDADGRLDTVEGNYLRGKVSATEPDHDGSQEDGDLWIKRA